MFKEKWVFAHTARDESPRESWASRYNNLGQILLKNLDEVFECLKDIWYNMRSWLNRIIVSFNRIGYAFQACSTKHYSTLVYKGRCLCWSVSKGKA